MIVYIIIAIFAWVVYRQLAEIRTHYRHIDDETVREYMTGRLRRKTKEYHRVIKHLGLCEDCQRKMIEFDENYSSDKNLEDHLIEKDE